MNKYIKRLSTYCGDKRLIIFYAVVLGVFIAGLKSFEYKIFISSFSVEFYLGVIAIAFIIFGIWLGQTLTSGNKTRGSEFVFNQKASYSLGITLREKEMLELMAG